MTRPVLLPLLPRPRLAAAFRGPWKVGVLTAPAGFGKSTLARQVMGPGAIWIRLESADRAPGHLLGSWLAAAARLPGSPLARTRRLFLARRDFERDGGLLTSSLTDELSRSGPWRVVLDDAHSISGARETPGWLARIIESSGDGVRFMITARGENPVPLARVSLEAVVVRCDAGALAFTTQEAERFLRKARPELRDRARRTELARAASGWAAGLVLLARGRGPGRVGLAGPATGDDAAARRALFALLAEQIIAPLPAEMRRGLASAATLETLDPELLADLLGRTASRRLLGGIARHDLFAAPAHEGGPLRFHPLFQEFLADRFVSEFPERERARWHRRLARALSARGEVAGAIRAELASGDLVAARRRFERAARAPGERGAALGRAAVELHRQAPDQAALSPWIHMSLAAEARDAGDFSNCRDHAHAAQRGFAALAQHEAVARAFVLEAGAASLTARHREAAEHGEDLLKGALRSRLARGLVAAHAGSLWLGAGDGSRAAARLREAVALLRDRGREAERADAEVRLATVDFTRGRWGDYLARAERALAEFQRAGHATRAQTLRVNMAEACIYLGEEIRAEEHLEEARRLAPRSLAPTNAAFIAIGWARAASERGEHAEAARRFRGAREVLLPMGLTFASHMLDVWEGVHERRRGRLAIAAGLLDRAADGFSRLQSPAWLALARMESALVKGLQGQGAAARSTLAATARHSRHSGDLKELARNHLFTARLLQLEGRPFAPRLREALNRLEREGYLVLLRKERDITQPLLASAGEGPRVARARTVLGGEGRVWRGAARTDAEPRAGRKRTPALLEIRLAGGLRVKRAGRETRFDRRASAALVAMLALRRGEPARREEIAECLWPGAPPAASRNRFDVTLSVARRALEPEVGPRGPFRWLRAEHGVCWLERRGLRLDLDAFDTAARGAEPLLARLAIRPWETAAPGARGTGARLRGLERALALAPGELLPEFAGAGWCEEERTRLRERRQRLRIAAAAEALALSRHALAAEHAATARAGDAFDEAALRIELVALARGGSAAAAARRYREFVARLARELNAEPGPETALLATELGIV